MNAISAILIGIAIGVFIMTLVYHRLLFTGRRNKYEEDQKQTHDLLVEANNLRAEIADKLSAIEMSVRNNQ